MNRKTKQELNALSKEVFGTASKWQKLIEKGFIWPHEKVEEKVIPNTKTGVLEKKQFKHTEYVHIRHTEDTVRELMNNVKKQNDEKKVAVAQAAPSEYTDAKGPDNIVLVSPQLKQTFDKIMNDADQFKIDRDLTGGTVTEEDIKTATNMALNKGFKR